MSTFQASVPVLPASAPFTAAQRAWLNGFIAGLVGSRSSTSTAFDSAPAMTTTSPLAPPAQEEESHPWHDPALSISERLALAQDRPLERKLMAAMAQLDCGACGYLCKTYGEALANGEEKDTTRCAPGGRETAKKIKELLAARATIPPATTSTNRATSSPAKALPDRRNPATAKVLQCVSLNHPSSSKDTRLITFDIRGTGLSYKAGDSFGIFPHNCPDTILWILDALGASGDEPVPGCNGSEHPLREVLTSHYDLKKCTPTLIELMADSADNPSERAALREMLNDDGPGVPDGYELIDLLLEFPSARPAVDRLVAALSPLNPRLYSIASSPLAYPDEIHLTVGVVRYVNSRQRQCKGVASTFLAERCATGLGVKVFVQPSHGFSLPDDDALPIIMVGPGTGIAPFRAFLQDRRARSAKGMNWLFFGDQRREFDFLYERELLSYQEDGLLTRLDTAFSRDQQQKLYVQHRMLENAPNIWTWLQQGAHVYVCGDAKRMAADVHATLKRIAVEQGQMSEDAAAAFLADLTRAKRYQRDVY